MPRLRLLPAALFCLIAAGCARPPAQSPPTARQQQIERLQDFARKKGFPETGNFRRADPQREAWYLCYYTKPFELPDSYDDLGYKESKRPDCGLPSARYDVYLHRTEAVAFEDAPVTQSLENASPERALMVAAHEEVHEDPQLERLPHPVAEAASTLLGMLTAAEFAAREGDTVTATRLSGDIDLYAKKALYLNALHTNLQKLYEDLRKRRIQRNEASSGKQALFVQAREACRQWGTGHSINPCLPVENNAGLAFDHSYTRFYPQVYALYLACDRKLDRFITELRKLGQSGKKDLATIDQQLTRLIDAAGDRSAP